MSRFPFFPIKTTENVNYKKFPVKDALPGDLVFRNTTILFYIGDGSFFIFGSNIKPRLYKVNEKFNITCRCFVRNGVDLTSTLDSLDWI